MMYDTAVPEKMCFNLSGPHHGLIGLSSMKLENENV